MDTIGLDLHKLESQLCVLAGNGTITEQRIVTSRERFSAVLGSRSPARILLDPPKGSPLSHPAEALQRYFEGRISFVWIRPEFRSNFN